MSPRSGILIGFLSLSLLLLSSSVFILDQITQAIVLQFGEFRTAHVTPGLKFKLPFIQDVQFFEKRVVDYDSLPIDVKTVDKKRLIVDAYVRYKVSDVLKFYRSVQPANEYGARTRLDSIVPSSIQNVLGKIPLRNLLSPERVGIMARIRDEIAKLTQFLGLEIVDVRIVRTELPVENQPAVFERFNQMLIRSAKGNRADGEKKSRFIKAQTDKEQVTILAEAQKKAQGIRGRGDAKAMQIANAALSKSPKLYSLLRSFESYKQTFDADTNIYLNEDHPYLQEFFNSPSKADK